LSSLRVIIAATQQLSCFSRAAIWSASVMTLPEGVASTGSIDSTTPTRVPPILTSLSWVRRAAFGTTIDTRYVGTNGSPLFAL
jgi:hypothetical protein